MIERALDWAAGVLGVLIVLELAKLPPSDRVTRTMLLEDGQLVHIVSEPRDECRTLRDAIEYEGATVEVSSPWGITYRVRRIWCGNFAGGTLPPPPEEQSIIENGEKA